MLRLQDALISPLKSLPGQYRLPNIYGELRSILKKTYGLADVLREALGGLRGRA
jgi:hypothetical protein